MQAKAPARRAKKGAPMATEFGDAYRQEAANRGIWIPVADDVKDEQHEVDARIVDAQYDGLKEAIALWVSFPDGSRRMLPIHKSAWTFDHRKWDEVPKEFSDEEMRKTAALFNRNVGKRIKVLAYQAQLEGGEPTSLKGGL